MTITIQAENIYEARQKLGLSAPNADITIKWRRGPTYDYGSHDTGCIVNAVGLAGEDVPRSFKTGAEAIRYISGLINKHEAHVRDEQKKRAVELKKAKK